MGYAVLHLEKATGTDSGMSAHIERTIAPKNADPNRTPLNKELIKFPDEVSNRTEAIQHRLETAGLQRKIGKNQVHAIRILLTGSPDDMKRIEQEGRLDEWCNDNLEWLRKTYGNKNIVSAVLHLDESTPHIHATMIPIVTGERRKAKEVSGKYRKKSGSTARLCADDVMSRVRLKEYQNTYAEQMAKYGLQRGIEGSEAKHLTTSQYYRDLIAQGSSVQTNIGMLRQEEQQTKKSIDELIEKEYLAKVKYEQLEERVENKDVELYKTTEILKNVKSAINTERLKKVKTETATVVLESIGTVFGSTKFKEHKKEIEVLKVQNHALKTEIENLNVEINHLHKDIQTIKTEHNGIITKLKEELNNIYELFPHIKELLKFETFCRAVGFGTEMIKRIFNRESVRFSGGLYSHEYQRKFNTEHSVAKMESTPTESLKFALHIDGVEIYQWFRLKQKELLQKLGIDPIQKQNRGIKR